METNRMRKMNCEVGILSRPDGSALFTLGDSVVLAAVYGPCEVRPQKLSIEKATIDVIFKPKAGLSGISDKLKESTLFNLCNNTVLSSQYPRTMISIIVQEMQDFGGLLACSINSVCLALMNAGVPMKFLFAATCCMVDANGQIVLDPDIKQLKDSKSVFTLVFEGIQKDVIATETSGVFSCEQFEEVLTLCREASHHIFQFYRDVIKKYGERLSPT